MNTARGDDRRQEKQLIKEAIEGESVDFRSGKYKSG
jgi:hypothetical protein